MCSSLGVRDQVTKKIEKIMVLYILIFKFLERGWENKRFLTDC
jgi:hypothetical protein